MVFNWDGERNEDELIFRRMLWDDPHLVYRDHGAQKLREVFLTRGHQAPRRTRSFWMLILEIDKGEFDVDRDPERSFRASCKIWDY